jgi:Bacterial SH3 domain
LRARRAIAAAISLALAVVAPAFAQTAVEYPGALPNTTITPAEGDSEPAPSPPLGGSESTPAGVPAGPESGAENSPAEVPPPVHRRPARHRATSPASSSWSGAVEPAKATLTLKEDSWAYARPSKSSKRIERVTAGKFVNVTGTTRYYLQVNLKSGTTGYVPISAARLTRPVNKFFHLTSDAPVFSEPTHYGKKLSQVHKGHDVHVVGISMNYMKIRMKDGLEGYIPQSALE